MIDFRNNMELLFHTPVQRHLDSHTRLLIFRGYNRLIRPTGGGGVWDVRREAQHVLLTVFPSPKQP
jgi:hypothetical protein